MRRAIPIAVGCAAIVGALTGTAQADPDNDNSIINTAFNCVGPPGTPSSFQYTKILNGGSGFHVVGTTDTFRRTSVTDLVLGQPPRMAGRTTTTSRWSPAM